MLFSGIAIIILLPFMISIMIGLKLTGDHYIFYEQERIGKNGRPFNLLKIATMLKDNPNMAGGMYTSMMTREYFRWDDFFGGPRSMSCLS